MAVDRPLELERWQVRTIDYIHQKYMPSGKIPSEKDIRHYAAISPAQMESFWISQGCLDALQERGIDLNWDPNAPLLPEQLLAIEKVTDPSDKRSLQAKLKQIGITTVRWNSWMMNDAFSEVVTERSKKMVANSAGVANTALLSQVERGNMAAIEYVNKMTGRFNPSQNQTVDVALILTRVFDIIQKHVHDQGTLAQIGNDLMVLDAPVAKALER